MMQGRAALAVISLTLWGNQLGVGSCWKWPKYCRCCPTKTSGWLFNERRSQIWDCTFTCDGSQASRSWWATGVFSKMFHDSSMLGFHSWWPMRSLGFYFSTSLGGSHLKPPWLQSLMTPDLEDVIQINCGGIVFFTISGSLMTHLWP